MEEKLQDKKKNDIQKMERKEKRKKIKEKWGQESNCQL